MACSQRTSGHYGLYAGERHGNPYQRHQAGHALMIAKGVTDSIQKQSEAFAARVSLESLLKQRDNTIRQLRESNLKCVWSVEHARKLLKMGLLEAFRYRYGRAAGCRKEDTQVCDHIGIMILQRLDQFVLSVGPEMKYLRFCTNCGVKTMTTVLHLGNDWRPDSSGRRRALLFPGGVPG
ncbi:hypothetical protein GH714_044138 [Hevea brasiliensis]|uniref:Uncharacterized protein n=1 Tax=Hevea brasiliensis TaxID=3981 RepID=A0A6A6K1B0_HEVBR|nr:hypothetical protein GH714_044138 [Hevea brasiliensis]